MFAHYRVIAINIPFDRNWVGFPYVDNINNKQFSCGLKLVIVERLLLSFCILRGYITFILVVGGCGRRIHITHISMKRVIREHKQVKMAFSNNW